MSGKHFAGDSSKQEKGRKYLGGKFLEIALNEAYRRLGNERIDNLYRASLLGGDVGARLMLAHDERCLRKWVKGSLNKAVRLLEVWASTAVLRLLQHEEDQESVRDGTARGFSLLFKSDEGELEAELLAYQQTMKAESEALRRREQFKPEPKPITDLNNPITGTIKDIYDHEGSEGGRAFARSNEILYLRTLRALGDEGVPSFKLLPMPWGTLREMSEANPKLFEVLDVNILLPVEPWLLVPDVLISTLQTAQDYFNRMEAQG